MWDEFFFHLRRGLPKWERIGHPMDTISVILPFIYLGFFSYSGDTPVILVLLMMFSCLLITKDEWIHAEFSTPGENWLHALLFILHPLVFVFGWLLWKEEGPTFAHRLQLALLSSFLIYQLVYWHFIAKKVLPAKKEINNDLYHDLGDRWYTAKDDPVALLRAEGKTKNPWVMRTIQNHFPDRDPCEVKILDVGCGAGFLTNYLAKKNFNLIGMDVSKSSLEVARKFDETKRVNYLPGDAYQLPFLDHSFDVVTCMDFLEHVDQPAKVVQEISRVLKPNGIFIFHTFNRNPLSHLVIIKGVEWFVKNTPEHMHIIDLFVKPEELKNYCAQAGLNVKLLKGIAPKVSMAFFKMLFTGEVPDDFEFKITPSTLLSYVGYAVR